MSSAFLRGSRALFAANRSAASSSKTKPKPKPKPKPSAAKDNNAKGRPSGLTILKPISPALQTFVGASEASRVEAVKKIWEHIKHNNLQNPSNKREIFCDEKLKKIFDGKDKVGFLEVPRLISPHFLKAN